MLLCATVGAYGACSDDATPKPNPEAGVKPEGGVNKEGGTTEASLPKEGGTTDGIVDECKGKADGATCSPGGSKGFICMSGKCSASVCGDKFVDKDNLEDCDDGNADSTDGCDGCKFGCKADADCDDKNTCNGTETCDTTAHKCKTGTTAADGTTCTLTGGGAGACNAGVCTTVGCGNGTVDAGEECDDKNKVNDDGCDNTCKWNCKADADCDDKNACNGKETCDLTKHTCKAGTALSCDDSKACTTDSCDPTAGCVNTPVDADKDGHTAAPCGDDCNDADPAVYTGAAECADAKDNDCDGKVDEAPLTSGKCWPDGDADSYALAGATPISQCTCPAGYTNRDPGVAGQADCREYLKDVNPAQTGWFTNGYCKMFDLTCATKSFDYNCSGVEEKRYNALYTVCLKKQIGNFTICTGSGWTTAAPACGATANYTSCAIDSTGTVCLASQSLKPQECH